MQTVNITADTVAAVFMTIIITGYYSAIHRGEEATKFLRYCMLTTQAGLILDALSYALDGRADSSLISIVNYFTYILIDIIIILAVLDLLSRIRKRRKIYCTVMKCIIIGLCVFDISTMTVGAITGRLFTIENGVFVAGPWSDSYSLILSLICCLVALSVVVSNARELGKKPSIIYILYFLLPGVIALIGLFIDGLQVAYVGLAVGISLFFILIQSRLMDEANVKSQMIYMQENTINGMASLIESRDMETGEHVTRTSRFVRLLAEHARHDGVYADALDDSFIARMITMAPMHDIGKIMVPDQILQKPGRLTEEEFNQIKCHASEGGKVIREVLGGITDEEYVSMASDIATYHHERWDGTGYPEGLSGEDIPLSARIMAIADVFDALIFDRCYRKALPLEKAIDIIRQESGTHFDPKLTEVFLNHVEDFNNDFEG